MRERYIVAISLALAGMSLLASGCQSSPKATPPASPTENVVIEVVTSTTQPTSAPTETGEPTITPLATFTPIGLESPTPQATATRPPVKTPVAPSTPKVAKSATPAPPTATPLQNKYAAPDAISPTTGDSYRDGIDIQFYFGAVGPLGANECYLLHVVMTNPNATSGGPAGDEFLDAAHCDDQSAPNTRLRFVLYRPKFANQSNYGTLESEAQQLASTNILKVSWYVRVVQNSGSDGMHHNVTFLSPPGTALEFDFYP